MDPGPMRSIYIKHLKFAENNIKPYNCLKINQGKVKHKPKTPRSGKGIYSYIHTHIHTNILDLRIQIQS